MHSRSPISAGGSRLVAVGSVVAMVLSAAVLVSAVREHRAAASPRAAPAEHAAPVKHAAPAEHVNRRRATAEDRRSRRAGESWRAVLAHLDGLRARAYAASAPRLLRGVYVPGSSVLREDRRLLRRYRSRGLTVIRLRTQVMGLRVRARRGAHVVLLVRDQVTDGVVVGTTTRHRLAYDEAETRAITLRREPGEGWQISAVRPA